MNKKQILWGIIIVAVLGIFDAGFLTYEHYGGGIPPCTINGCETVLTSPYSIILGFPISLLGVLFYLSVLFTAFILRKKDTYLIKIILLTITSVGFLFSLYLLYLQVSVIGALCQYCLFSFLFSTTLFVGVVLYFLKKDTGLFVLN